MTSANSAEVSGMLRGGGGYCYCGRRRWHEETTANVSEARATRGGLQSYRPVSATFAEIADGARRQRRGAAAAARCQSELRRGGGAAGRQRRDGDGLERRPSVDRGLPSPGKTEPTAELEKRDKAVNAEF